jgi:hypothetical protein
MGKMAGAGAGVKANIFEKLEPEPQENLLVPQH